MHINQCANCNSDNADNAKFCSQCGDPLPKDIGAVCSADAEGEAGGKRLKRPSRTRSLLYLLSAVAVIAIFVSIMIKLKADADRAREDAAAAASQGAAATRDLMATPPTFATDLAGQLARIRYEGGASPEGIETNLKAVTELISYAQLKKNPDKYAAKGWGIVGNIVQIKEREGMTWARISIGPNNSDVVYVAGEFTTEFVDDDQVGVIGYLAGDYSYTSEAGWTITLPALAARMMVTPKEAHQLARAKK